MTTELKLAMGTRSSVGVTSCQVCDSDNLKLILFLGYLPPVNRMNEIGSEILEQPSYPAHVLMCQNCNLVQLGCIVDPKILFPPEYPYTSSTTRILRENFTELSQESVKLFSLKKEDLILDIGSNDGNLLSNFKNNHRVLGVTPEDIGKIAIEKGIPTIIDYFTSEVADKIVGEYGRVKMITATNVFAHMENINSIVEYIKKILTDDGVFMCEVHYLKSLVEKLQYDTIYHEHMRYYSLNSLKYLLNSHDFDIVFAKEIPTHGGSLRIYASRKGKHPININVQQLLESEKNIVMSEERLARFREEVMLSKVKLYALILKIKNEGGKICGISAPSRASTLINYIGLNEMIVSYIVEVQGSHKIGKFVPGTIIPVVKESILFEDQPEYAILFSWHIADEIIPKLRANGYKGKFIVPLPEPHIV